jgi:hypothetical protein
MNIRKFVTRLLLVGTVATAAPVNGRAEDSPKPDPMATYQSLLDNSPFLTKEFRERRRASADFRHISFHGGVQIEGRWLLCFHDRQKNETVWVAVGETLNEHIVKSYAENRGEVVLERGGNTTTLPLQ